MSRCDRKRKVKREGEVNLLNELKRDVDCADIGVPLAQPRFGFAGSNGGTFALITSKGRTCVTLALSR